MNLFLPQKVLEEWAVGDKADLAEGKLLVRESNSSHAVLPAVHFTKLVGGKDDSALVGKVKTMVQLDALGAEHMMDAVQLGETTYEVIPGYITEVAAPAQATAAPEVKKKPSSPEADLLAAFILDKL